MCIRDSPYYKGTGELYLESSLGGFHTVELNDGETWVIQNGAYWASEEGIALSLYRERFLTAFFAGEGLFWYQTKISGKGKAVVIAPGPVDEMTLNNERLVFDGNYVVARTAGISFTIRRPTRSRLGYYLSGERYSRVYEGTGRLASISTTTFYPNVFVPHGFRIALILWLPCLVALVQRGTDPTNFSASIPNPLS